MTFAFLFSFAVFSIFKNVFQKVSQWLEKKILLLLVQFFTLSVTCNDFVLGDWRKKKDLEWIYAKSKKVIDDLNIQI
jgi:hypothetical protein